MIDQLLDFDFRTQQPDEVRTCARCNITLDDSARKVCFDGDTSPAALDLMSLMFIQGDDDDHTGNPLGMYDWEIRRQYGQPKHPADAKGIDVTSSPLGKCELAGIIKPEYTASDHAPSLTLRGDTLLTCKSMLHHYLRQSKRRPYTEEEIDFIRSLKSDSAHDPIDICAEHGHLVNDQSLPSLFLIPYFAGCALNGPRGIDTPYFDNPFIFFSDIREAYRCEDDRARFEWCSDGNGNTNKRSTRVRANIYDSWSFWSLFGEGEEGFMRMLDRMCLRAIADPDLDEFTKPCDRNSMSENEARAYLRRYFEALDHVGQCRHDSMKERLEKIYEREPATIERLYGALFS